MSKQAHPTPAQDRLDAYTRNSGNLLTASERAAVLSLLAKHAAGGFDSRCVANAVLAVAPLRVMSAVCPGVPLDDVPMTATGGFCQKPAIPRRRCRFLWLSGLFALIALWRKGGR